jgi:hypothetical protein
LGGSYNIIEHNTIRDNGKGLGRFLDGKPIFNDPTRYAINMEDSYGANCVIRHNDIYGSYHGLLLGCYDIDVYSNNIYNIDYIAINIYGTITAKISGNTLYNCQVNLGVMSPVFYSPYINVTDNTFIGGTTNLTSVDYRIEVMNNRFDNPVSILINDNCTFSHNHVTYTETITSAWIKSGKIKDCTFKSLGTQRELTMKVYEFDNCSFENLRVRIEPLNTKISEVCTIKNSELVNCEVRNHIFSGSPLNTEFKNCKLTDTVVQTGITNTDNQTPYTSLEDCSLVFNSKLYLFYSETNREYTTYKAIRCKVTINNATFIGVLFSGAGTLSNEVVLKECSFNYTGATPLALKYYTNKNHMRKFTSQGNTFTNINLPVPDAGIFVE